MGAASVGALIAFVFLHMLPEAAEGDADGRFAWRTGTSIMGGIMTAFLLESIVHAVRAVMGMPAHAHAHGGMHAHTHGALQGHTHTHGHTHGPAANICDDSPCASVRNGTAPVDECAYVPVTDPVPGVGVGMGVGMGVGVGTGTLGMAPVGKEIANGPCCDHAPERLVMPPEYGGTVDRATSHTSRAAGGARVMPQAHTRAVERVVPEPSGGSYRGNQVAPEMAFGSPAGAVIVPMVPAQHGHVHPQGALVATPPVPVNDGPTLKGRVTQKLLSIHSVVYVILLGEVVHSLLCDMSTGWAVTAAIVLHEVPQELSDYMVLRRAGLTACAALGLNLASATAILVGAIVGLATSETSETARSVLLAYCAGILIFVALVDILPDLMTITDVRGKWMATGQVAKRFLLIVAGAVAVGLTMLHDKHCEALHGGGHEGH
eukprot:jgi/Mesvir1/28579/Mv00994-RA.1